MLRLMVRLLVVSSALLGCSSTPDPVEVPSANSSEAVSAQPTAPPRSTSTAPSENLTRELSVTDCIALAQKYESLTRSEEMAKLPVGLTAEQIAVSESQLARGAKLLAERWEEGCVKSLVGKEHPESNLRCAMASKTVSAFDVCLNGPADPAPTQSVDPPKSGK